MKYRNNLILIKSNSFFLRPILDYFLFSSDVTIWKWKCTYLPKFFRVLNLIESISQKLTRFIFSLIISPENKTKIIVHTLYIAWDVRLSTSDIFLSYDQRLPGVVSLWLVMVDTLLVKLLCILVLIFSSLSFYYQNEVKKKM